MVSGFRFKGSIGVNVDPSHLEARLELSRQGDLEYDEGAVVRTLSDAGVTEGFDLDEVLGQIQAFNKKKEPSASFVAARGKAPTPPQPETWEWAESLALSDDLKPIAAAVLKAAGPPSIYQVRVEKVKVEKTTPGKGGLFGAAEERQTVVETREIREKVLVDPTPLRLVWVEAGTLVARVYPPKPGVPGTDLAGKPLPAPAARAVPFHLGNALDRQKFEVIAGASGFLRVGRNWADLVPYRHHRWSVTYSEDRTSAFLTFEPGGASSGSVAASAVLSQIAADGFSSAALPSEADLQALLDDALASGTALLSHPLVPDRDGTFVIRYSPDQAKAFLDLRKPLGRGTPLSLKDLGAALKDAQLKGFSFDAVKGVLQEFLAGPSTELLDFALASGTSPTRGKDLEIVFAATFLPPEELASVTAQLQATPRYLEAVPDRAAFPPDRVERAAPVKAGQEFARLVAPEGGAGAEGMDVHGKVIPAIPGNDPPLKLLANVQKNGDALEATIDGLMETAVLDGVAVFRVRPHLDAMAIVTRSDDNLQATLSLVQGRGTGRRLDRALVDRALEAAQIRSGLLTTKVDEALEAAAAGTKVENWVIAEGIPPANDFQRRLVFAQPPRVSGGKHRLPVRTTELVATYTPPQEGQIDGTDVLGNLIPSPDMDVRSLVVSEDFDVTVDDQGRHVIHALKSGEAVFDGETLTLVGQIAVAAVGGKAGNVKFPGEVVVAGAIETGSYVMAGNLKVRGRVGGALLSSDQNIQVADGIHGEGKAVLRAKKHVSVGFVERALVMAVGDVHVGKAALSCTFRVNGRVLQKTPGGGLQGGLAKVRLGLDVMNLGSPSGITTTISFGQDYLVEDQIQAEVKETDKLREAIVQLDVLMRNLVAPSDRDKLNSARQKKVLLMKMLDKRNLRLIHLRDKFDLHVPSEIVVRETLFPGVSIESHGRLYEPKTRRTAVRIVFNEQTGHIEERPLA